MGMIKGHCFETKQYNISPSAAALIAVYFDRNCEFQFLFSKDTEHIMVRVPEKQNKAIRAAKVDKKAKSKKGAKKKLQPRH